LIWIVKQVEVNQLRAMLHRLDLSDDFIARYIQKLQNNGECFKVACKTIDRWEKPDSSQFVLQALVCGCAAAILGGWLAMVS
jgi:hypothetical protein